jgi:hypothetical protein
MTSETMAEGTHDIVSRYFEADALRSTEAILSLFADDAVVIDEGHTWRGVTQIRDWRLGPASKYDYSTTIARIERTDGSHYRASGRIDGNFPGATAELKWDFVISEGRISRLEIAP